MQVISKQFTAPKVTIEMTLEDLKFLRYVLGTVVPNDIRQALERNKLPVPINLGERIHGAYDFFYNTVTDVVKAGNLTER